MNMKRKIPILVTIMTVILLAGCGNASSDGSGTNTADVTEETVSAAEETMDAAEEETAAAEEISYSEMSAEEIDAQFYITEIDDALFERIKGKTYKDDCTVPVDDLRYIHLLNKDIDGSIHEGEMICNKYIAEDVLEIFKELYDADYPIERVCLMDDYDADDELAMEDNNSSCFNFRFISHTTRVSKHGLGLAVDINTLYNPYIKTVDGELIIEPVTAEQYTDRSKDFDYKIDENDLAYKLFTEHGFEWGGSWEDRKDYQHFEIPTDVIEELYPSQTSDSTSDTESTSTAGIRIGVAWRADTDSEFYTNICKAIEEAGGEAVLLDQVIDSDLNYTDRAIAAEGITENDYLTDEYADIVKDNTYHNSNVEEVFSDADVDAVIFTGGEDISPTLTAVSTGWHHIEEEKDYNATRDVSDYLLMSYCIDNDIPAMGFCRGMQMLAVVSGATMIQDLPAYYTEQGLSYNYEHRNQKASADAYRDYAPHDITIESKDSIIYDIFGSNTVKNVPSWHHQAVLSVEGTALEVTATTETDGIDIIEAIERTDKTLIMGFQFHPEAAIVKNLEQAENAGEFMDYDTAILVFKYLIEQAEEQGILTAA